MSSGEHPKDPHLNEMEWRNGKKNIFMVFNKTFREANQRNPIEFLYP